MIEQNTISLLRECDAGIRMGIDAINEVIDDVVKERLREILNNGLIENKKLEKKLRLELNECKDDGKSPRHIAKGMSFIKTNIKLCMENSDATIADLMTDECSMGAKSLSRYLNEYKNASENSKNIAREIIILEEQLAYEMRSFL